MRKRKIRAQVWLNEAERDRVDLMANRAGLSREGYLRFLIRGYVPKEAPTLDYLSLMKELRAIGNRMNQIAAKANAVGFFMADEYKEQAAQLRKNILEIQQAFVLPEKM